MMTSIQEGLTLEEALEKYSDPKVWDEYQKTKKERGEVPAQIAVLGHAVAGLTEENFPILKATRELLDPFLRKLESGELVAAGYDSRHPGTAGRIKIPSDLWKYLVLNTRDSTAHADTYCFQGVRIQVTERLTIKAVNNCRAWLSKRIKTGERPLSQQALCGEAREQFPGLSIRAFEGLWKEMAPPKWKKPGRRPRSATPTLPSDVPRNGMAADQEVGPH